MKIILSPLLIILILCPLFVFAQKSDEISVNMTAENRKTGFIKDLKGDDLKIKFGKGSPTVTSLHLDDGPATIGILFDTSGSMNDWRISNGFKPSLFLDGIERLVNSGNPANEYFVVGFNQKTTLLADKTQSQDVVTKALESLRDVKPEGNTRIYDALDFGLENLSHAKFKKRILLIISDGTDNTSKSSFDIIRQLLKGLDVMLYSVCIDGTIKFTNINDIQGMAVLGELTSMSGGRALYVRKPTEINEAFEKISNELHNQYKLGFVPSEQKKGAWNKLKIEILSKSSSANEGKIDLRYRAGLIY